jgi:two-component system sensor histidine kinase YesM
VENVIVHGVRSGKKVTAITLASRIEDDGAAIAISIEDNGKGIKPERLEELQQALSSMVRLSGSSIGLMNVHDRIRLLYGPDYGVSVDSVWNEGTVVKLRIPYQKGGNGLV